MTAQCPCRGCTNAYQKGVNDSIAAIQDYSDERLVITKHPNMSEDITAALRVVANRLRALKGDPK